MNRKIAAGFVFLFFSLGLARPVSATAVRTEVLGREPLLPDPQQDLDQVPAFLHALEGPVIFGRFGLNWDRSETDFNGSSTLNKNIEIFPSVEYASPRSRLPFAVR